MFCFFYGLYMIDFFVSMGDCCWFIFELFGNECIVEFLKVKKNDLFWFY